MAATKAAAADRRVRLRARFRSFLRKAPVGKDGIARVAARQIYIVPTEMGLLYALVVAAMVLGSLNFQNNLGLMFGFLMAGVGLVAMHRCWFNLLGLAAQVRGGSPVFVGQAARFEVVLRNERRAARYDIRALGGIGLPTPALLEPLDQASVSLAMPTSRRGLLALQDVEIETRHPMHLFKAWCYVQSGATCIVYPQAASDAPAPASASGELCKAVREATGDGAEDFLGLREYRAGDSLRRLDWKALARERGLVVKEFGGDEGLDVWIDWRALPTLDLERRISQMTRQVLDAAEGSYRFGLRLPGVEIALGRGEGQVELCLRELALFRYEDSHNGIYRPPA
jgi:uncharacterized protein (DUF58 family)